MNKNVLESKKSAVAKIKEGLKANSAVAIIGYQGFSVAELTELRHKLAEKNSTVAVFKNTMIARALKDEGITGLDQYLEGPNALVFSEKETEGLAVLRKFGRYHENLVIRGGLVDGTVLDNAGLMELARLPDKNGMISMLLSCLNAPITKFAATVKAVADKQQPAAN